MAPKTIAPPQTITVFLQLGSLEGVVKRAIETIGRPVLTDEEFCNPHYFVKAWEEVPKHIAEIDSPGYVVILQPDVLPKQLGILPENQANRDPLFLYELGRYLNKVIDAIGMKGKLLLVGDAEFMEESNKGIQDRIKQVINDRYGIPESLLPNIYLNLAPLPREIKPIREQKLQEVLYRLLNPSPRLSYN